ncbi:hypothetical protein EfmJHP36_08820 [Enterococcus faecium]|nr:hypothetical protein EfmJHP36_08820 [Enterococcus faecium]
MENGETGNFTLTSTKKNVGAEVKEFAETSHNDKFPGGKHLTFGLKEEGVDLTKGQLSEEAYIKLTTTNSQKRGLPYE